MLTNNILYFIIYYSEADVELQCGNSLTVELPSPKRLVRVRFLLSVFSGGFPERSKGSDCKSDGLLLRRFESCIHHFYNNL